MVYIHIPYCRRHCTYCAFYSELLPKARGSESCAAGVPDAFVDALVREIAAEPRLEEFKAVHPTLYLGGGTPSLLSPHQLGRIVKALGRFDYEEFTIEVNPDDILDGGEKYVRALASCGVNRVSMGIQSLDDRVLHRMGRRHNADGARKAYDLLLRGGIANISVDFIFGFEGNGGSASIREFIESLPAESRPQHISCYQLGIDSGSALEKMLDRGLITLPSDDECAAEYACICEYLQSRGYDHYEISNWAQPGFESRHNSAYWDHTPYIGFGPGAHSLIVSDNVCTRRWNNPDASAYIAAASAGDFDSIRGSETLSAEQLRDERVMLCLRTARGIDPGDVLSGDASRRDFLEFTPQGRLRIRESSWFVSDSLILQMLD